MAERPYDPDTLAVRAGIRRSDFQEHSEALVLTSSFVFKSAEEAARRFANEEPGNIYSRFTNPTVAMFQDRLAALEGGEACIATSTGMAAIATLTLGLLKSGDHVVSSRSVFGTITPLFNQILGRFGVDVTWVDPTDNNAWRAAMQPGRTRLLFSETPSNPMAEVCDIQALSTLAHDAGALLAIDNCFCSPALQQPLALGADLVVHSATKYLDGQGRVLAGALVGSSKLVDGPLYQFVRTAGPALSPFNAWVCLKGMETLGLRMQAQSASAFALAEWLEGHHAVERVHYTGLKSHPQHELALRQQRSGGAVVSFEVRGGRDAAWRLINATRMLSITANLGDTKSTICHPASTTHGRLTSAEREQANIREGLVRIAVGLESLQDLQADIDRGLS